MDAIVEAAGLPILVQSPWHIAVVKVTNAEEYGALRRIIKAEGIQTFFLYQVKRPFMSSTHAAFMHLAVVCVRV